MTSLAPSKQEPSPPGAAWEGSASENGRFRRPLLALAALCLAGLAADTALALSTRYLPVDLTLTRAVQSVDWGPLGLTFGFYTWLAGFTQLAVALAAIVLVFLIDRRAAPLMTCGALTGVFYQALNLLVHRPRPDASLVRVVTHMQGAGYPSGHAAFFSSFSVLLLYCLAYRRVPGWAFAAGWVVVLLVAADARLSRVAVGAHWPSDVAAGLFIGVGWTALVMSFRRLSDPVLER